MKLLSQLFKYYSLAKGKIYTLVGIVIIGVSLKIMYDNKSITQDSIELLLTGAMIAGVNHEAIKTIIDSSTKSDTPK